MIDFSQMDKLLSQATFPAAFLDLDAFDHNIELFKNSLIGKNRSLRICSKSLRCGKLIQRILESGDVFNGVLSYSSSDAVFLADKYGVKDIVIAYPTVNKNQVKELINFLSLEKNRDNGVSIAPMVDCVDHLEIWSQEAKQQGIILDIALDLDVGYKPIEKGGVKLGAMRSPLRSADQLVKMAKKIQSYPNLRLRGIMGYEAQSASTPDLKLIHRLLKIVFRKQVNERRRIAIDALKKAGFELEFVNGGGSGCYLETAAEPDITEIGVGSAFYKSWLFDGFYSLSEFKPSLYFALEVVRKPQNNVITCYSGGYISSGPAKLTPIPVYPQGLNPFSIEGYGEVQTPFSFNPVKYDIKVGDKVILRPGKAGEPLERFNTVYVIKNMELVDQYPTFRGEGYNFG